MNVLFSSDDNYAPLLGVSIFSLLKNNYNDFNEINIIILDGGISKENQEKIKSICERFPNEITLQFIKYKNLEEIIDSYIKKIDKMDAFIVPGTSLISANLHIARTICRKSERRICTLSKVENVNPLLLKYINRLSDVLYAIARFNESELIYIKY